MYKRRKGKPKFLAWLLARPAKALADELNVSRETIYKWRDYADGREGRQPSRELCREILRSAGPALDFEDI